MGLYREEGKDDESCHEDWHGEIDRQARVSECQEGGAQEQQESEDEESLGSYAAHRSQHTMRSSDGTYGRRFTASVFTGSGGGTGGWAGMAECAGHHV